MMEVHLLEATEDPDRLVALVARRCYSSLPAATLAERLTRPTVERLLATLRRRGHLSPFEQVSFTFSVAGVSRVLSHQLVRHRLASYAQESQRYVRYVQDGLPYVTPAEIERRPAAREVYQRACEQSLAAYRELLDLGVAPEDARYVFPNGIETKLVFSFNARSLFNFFEQRCCLKAQTEIRELAHRMLALCRQVAPLCFATAGPPCRYPVPYCREDDGACPAYPHRPGAGRPNLDPSQTPTDTRSEVPRCRRGMPQERRVGARQDGVFAPARRRETPVSRRATGPSAPDDRRDRAAAPGPRRRSGRTRK